MTWYYVDPVNGTGAGTGTEASPYRAMSEATLVAGDIVHFKKGTTYRAEYDVEASGTATQPLIFRSYGTGAKPIIDGADLCKGFILYGSDVVTDGGFENWTTSATPDDWTEEIGGTNDVLKEASGMFMGSACAKLVLAEDDTCHVYQTFSATDIEASQWYRIPFAAKSDVIGGKLQYKVVKDLAGSPYYWDDGADTWTTNDTWNDVSATATLEWGRFSADFQSEADAESYAYTIYLGPVTDESDNWGNFWIDAVSCGKVAGNSTNEVNNWLFSEWDSSTVPTDWRALAEGSGIIKRSDNERYGTYGVEMGLDSDGVEVSLRQNWTAGDIAGGNYRFCMHHHKFRQNADCDGHMGVRMTRLNGAGTAWNTFDATAQTWDPTHEMTKTAEEYEYNYLRFRFDISAARDYRFYINPPFTATGTAAEVPIQYERLWADAVSIISDDITADCTWAYMDAEPGMVYVTGTIDGVAYDHLQLYEDTTTDDKVGGSGDPYPHIFGYYYDSGTGKLYINLGADPGDMTIECSMRNGTFNGNGKSYFTIEDFTFQHTKQNGLDLGYSAAVGNRPTDITVTNCDSKYAGWVGILAGQRPTDPDTTDEFPDGTGYTPSNVTVEDCYVLKYNRARAMNLECEKLGATLSDQWWNWYSVPNAGIWIASGIQDTTEAGSDSKDIYVRRCEVECDYPIINFSTERNGIWASTGENVYIEENKVTGTDHGIFVIGGWMLVETSPLHYGDVYNFEIKGNLVYDTGDDSCWVQGTYLQGSKVCFNVFGRNGDNCIDIEKAALVEIYNNTFYGDLCENEVIVIWVNYYNPTAVGAYIYNNVFDRWGDVWYELSPGVARGVAIGIGSGADTGDSIYDSGTVKIDHNTYYQPTTATDTVDYPFYIATNNGDGTAAITRKTFSEWQSLGYDLNSTVEDPVTNAPDSDDYTYKHSSPVFGAGTDMTKMVESIYFSATALQVTRWFDKDNAYSQCLAQSSSWPDAVVWEDQPTLWHRGAWGKPTATITKDAAEDNFPVDGSLRGAPAFLVDATNHRIWKGIILSNTASALTLDAWEPIFNADDVGPTGSLSYYIGYVCLYDKTPQYAWMNTWRNKTLREIELHGKRVSGDVPIYGKISVNEGGATDTNAGTLSDDHRVRMEWLGGMHNIFQFEHALLVNQEFNMKSTIYKGSWRHGSLEQ